MKLKVLLAALASFALGACATLEGMYKAPASLKCGNACQVNVTVTAGTGGCSISVDNTTVEVNRGTAVITWTLRGPAGYAFAQGGGIVFNKRPGPPLGTFVVQQAGDQRIVLVDKYDHNAKKGKWAYSIYVTNGAGDDCRYDPWVDNN